MRRWLSLLLAGCLLCPSVWAKDPTVFPEDTLQRFLGLDDTSAPTQVADGRAQDLQNVILDFSGSLRQRYGIDLIGDPLDIQDEGFQPITSLAYSRFSSGTERIISTVSNRFYYLSSGTWTEAVVTSPITGGQNNQFVWVSALDNLIGTNGVDVPIQWAGASTDRVNAVTFTGLSNSIQYARSVAFFKNYLIFGNTREGSTTYSTRIRWSDVGTINTWTNANFIDIDALAGQEITAMKELYDNLYIFLNRSIYRVSLVGGSQTFQVAKVVDGIGCIAKNSVQEITLTNGQRGLVFLDGAKRIYFLNGNTVQDISQLIQTTLNTFTTSRLAYAVSATNRTDYYLCATVSNNSVNTSCIDFQYEIGEWTKHTNLRANAMSRVIDSSGLEQVYFGNDKAMVYQLANSSLKNDVGGTSGTLTSVDVLATSTASSLQVLYVSTASLTTGALAGAPINIVGGMASGLSAILASNTSTGLILTSALSSTPNSTSTFEVGAIDSYYKTKWYPLGQPIRYKHLGELYFWADNDVSSNLTVNYAIDFNSAATSTTDINLAASTTTSTWGSGLWGTAIWGSGNTVFKKFDMSTDARYVCYTFDEDDVDEAFHLYGFNTLYWVGDLH